MSTPTTSQAFLFGDDDTGPDDTDNELLGDLKSLIRNHDAARPRSQQKTLGPSEVGHPCVRKLAQGLMQVDRINPTGDVLPSYVGTAVHAQLEQAVALDNGRIIAEHLLDTTSRCTWLDGKPIGRWISERRVTIRPDLAGSCDLYDTWNHTVLDLKGLALGTPIPTPTGWTTMGDLAVGDQVIDAAGKPCTVTETSPVYTDRDCYRITFEDGVSVISDHIHQWVVQFGKNSRTRIMTAPEIAAQLRDYRGQLRIRIANTAALELPDANLPIEPYVLGAWLGDGESDSGRIGKPEPELFDNIAAAGSELGEWQNVRGGPFRRRIVGLTAALRASGLIGDKHVPPQYFRASRAQRLALLQGMMDTDGTWNRKRKQAVFTTTSKQLAHDAAELIASLGWKPRIWEHQARGFGVTTTAYPVTFVTYGDNPFRLTRKAEQVRTAGTTRAKRRIITAVERTLTIPTRCITVDSEDSTFLCTEAMIPTHNCPGTTKMTQYRKHGPSEVYRRQAHLYGRGYRNAGFDVQHVGIWFLPRAGQLATSHLWVEEYSDTLVDETLARIDNALVLIHDFDVEQHPERWAWFPKTPDSCQFCPWWTANQSHPNPAACTGGST